MIDEADLMVKVLSGKRVTFTSYELNGIVTEIPVVAGDTVTIPAGARGWYSWKRGSYLKPGSSHGELTWSTDCGHLLDEHSGSVYFIHE